jgi:D-alanyl-D-alanine carboxypeptidase
VNLAPVTRWQSHGVSSSQPPVPRGRRRDPRSVRRGRLLIGGLVVVIVLLAAGITVAAVRITTSPVRSTSTNTPSAAGAASASPSASTTPTPTATATSTPTPTAPAFDKKAHSLKDPTSIWVVVNKLRPLRPAAYAPADLVTVPVAHVYVPQLRKVASDAVVAMFAAYKAQTGKQMQSQSAYRSYPTQVTTYNGWVSSLGKAGADKTSARPGYSEHQTGLALDISAVPNTCALQACFSTTPQGKWLAANAYKWGFILRYPKDKTAVTGYEFEPWHFRYVGVPLATEMHTERIETLEEFFGLPAAPDYAN